MAWAMFLPKGSCWRPGQNSGSTSAKPHSTWLRSAVRGRAGVSVAIWVLLTCFLRGGAYAEAARVLETASGSNALPVAALRPAVAGTRLELTADSGFRVLLNGREVERETNVALRLPLGTYVLAVEAVNLGSNALWAVTLDPDWGVGAWIWDTNTFNKQTCRLWRSFVIPPGAKVTRARLDITADNGYRVLLDGREVGRGSDWRSVSEYDLTWLLPPGPHVLAVDAFNDAREAGVLAGLRIELTDGKVIEIPSDTSWRIVPEKERGWEHRRQAPAHWPYARVVGRFKGSPWAFTPTGPTRLPPLHPVELHFWNSGWFQIVLLSLWGVAVLACLQLMARLAMHTRSQKLLQRERARIARDIHDELGAGLTQLLLLGEVARKEERPSAEGPSGIERLCGKARGLSMALDEIVWAVNSRHDTLRDFTRHACKYAQSFFADTPIRCRLDVDSEVPPLPFELPVRRNLFLAVKEALNNAAKHSGASELFLRIHCQGSEVVVSVEDNGKGFDPASVSAERNGLTNLTQRMAEIGGTCELASKPGEGCRVTLRAPQSSRHRLAKWL